MRDTARVIKIEQSKNTQKIWVIPLLTDVCINCNESSCAKQGKPFVVANTKKLPVSEGCTVRVSAPAGQQALQAFFAVGLPVIAAIAGYYAPYIFTPHPPEFLQVCAVLTAFLATALTVLAVNRRPNPKRTAEITEIVLFTPQ